MSENTYKIFLEKSQAFDATANEVLNSEKARDNLSQEEMIQIIKDCEEDDITWVDKYKRIFYKKNTALIYIPKRNMIYCFKNYPNQPFHDYDSTIEYSKIIYNWRTTDIRNSQFFEKFENYSFFGYNQNEINNWTDLIDTILHFDLKIQNHETIDFYAIDDNTIIEPKKSIKEISKNISLEVKEEIYKEIQNKHDIQNMSDYIDVYFDDFNFTEDEIKSLAKTFRKNHMLETSDESQMEEIIKKFLKHREDLKPKWFDIHFSAKLSKDESKTIQETIKDIISEKTELPFTNLKVETNMNQDSLDELFGYLNSDED